MQIICAYLRENSNARKPVTFPLPGWQLLAGDAPPDQRRDYVEWRELRHTLGTYEFLSNH